MRLTVFQIILIILSQLGGIFLALLHFLGYYDWEALPILAFLFIIPGQLYLFWKAGKSQREE